MIALQMKNSQGGQTSRQKSFNEMKNDNEKAYNKSP